MILQKTFDNKGVAAPLIISGIIGLAALAGIPFIKPVVEGAMGGIANVLAGLMELLLPAVGHIFIWLGGLAANLINIFAVMNPFDPNTLAPFIWNTFKNIVYVVIIFLSLYAGFMYITGKDDQAQQLIYKIIVIALLINFSFLFAKEIFNVSFVITKNLASNFGQDPTYCPYSNCVGTAIHTSLLTFANPEISQGLANALSSQKGGAGAGDLFARVQSIFAHMIVLILYFIYTTIMFIFAGLFVGRFVMITFLVGLLPLAIIEWAIPKHSGRWEQWTKTFMIWTINIPVLLILVLIGFSITTAGIAGDFSQKLQQLSDARIYGGASNADASAQAYAGLLRYLFIVAYYAFAINYAQKIGGGAAVFGVNFAKGTYLTMAGAVVGAGKIGMTPVRQRLGGGLEKMGDWGLASKLGGMPIVGGFLQKTTDVGKKMKEPGEDLKKRAEIIVNSYKDDLSKAFGRAASEKSPLSNAILKHIDEKKSTEEQINALGQLDDATRDKLLKDKKRFALPDKIKAILEASSSGDMADALDKLSKSKTNFSALQVITRTRGKEHLLETGFTQYYSGLNRQAKNLLGTNLSSYRLAKNSNIDLGELKSSDPSDLTKTDNLEKIPEIRTLDRLISVQPTGAILPSTAATTRDRVFNEPDNIENFVTDYIANPLTDTKTSIIGLGIDKSVLDFLNEGKYQDAREKISSSTLPDDIKKQFDYYMDFFDLAVTLKDKYNHFLPAASKINLKNFFK